MGALNMQAIIDYFIYLPERPLSFSSIAFFVLFLFFYTLYISTHKTILWRTFYTLAFSLFFYYKSSGVYLLLLILSTVIDFTLGHFIHRATIPWKRRFFLWLSLGANLGLLGYFKYTNFILASIHAFKGKPFEPLDIFLPVGISFFTFQTMSYSIDVYRGKLVPLTDYVHDIGSFFKQLMDFAFFVSFFPQLVAGPIVRAAEFLPQINQRLGLTKADMGRGLLLICGGLFKKAVISDYISVNFVDRIFENPSLYSGLENLLGVYGFGVQIYCDFSGYSDMAIGLALLMGFTLPENFRTPYQSTSVQEFWRRWHISLSTWLRDYLYISLGGNRKGRFRTYVNLMLTMLLGGLWHGASWVFIVWGGLHGIALAFDRWLSGLGRWFKLDSLRSMLLLLLLHTFAGGYLYWLFRQDHLEHEQYLALSDANAWAAMGWFVTFVFAAGLDNLIRILYHRWKFRLSHIVSIVFVFQFVSFCWIFFRAGALKNPMPPLQTTGEILTQIFSSFHPELWPQVVEGYRPILSLIALAFFFHFLPARWDLAVERSFIRAPALAKAFALALVIWIVIQTASSDLIPFYYFQF